jgi:hypothetical protein
VDEATWERYALGELEAAERARLVDHVAGCAGCARAWRAVQGLAGEARALDPSLPAPAAAPTDRPRRRGLQLASAGLAAAAAVVLAVSLWPRPETLRGTPEAAIELEQTAPAGVAWPPVAGADEYRVRVFTDEGQPVFSATTRAPEASWPEASPGVYRWSVEALRGGDVIARSRLAPFRVR